MLKYVSKFTLDVLPSLLATVIGAYIVNHYIVGKPDAPVAAAVSTMDPKAESKAPETPSNVANVPEPGVRAKGISEKSIIDKSAVDKSSVDKSSVEKAAVEKPAAEKPTEKSADKPAETASIPVETKRHQPAPREKTAAKTVAPPVQPSAPAVMPVVAAPLTAPPAEAATAGEDRRDANDLARAAIERLRGVNDNAPRAQEAARTPDAPPRVVLAPPAEASRAASTPAVRPLPPPIMVSTPPAGEAFNPAAGSSQAKQPYADGARTDDARRPTPPADIPLSQPLDLRAEAADPSTREHKNVAEDMLSAAKSVFHAVLPK
jgi:hypothetical protein